MDKKTLLVLCDVTAAQYEPARYRMMKEGINPQVVRKESDKFLLSDMELIDEYLDLEARKDAHNLTSRQEMDRLIGELVAKHLQGFTYPIGAVIMDDRTWSEWTDSSLAPLVNALSVDRWIMYDDGRLEYAG